MPFRGLVVLVVVLSALGLAWQQRERLRAAVMPEPVVVIGPGGGDLAGAPRPAGEAAARPTSRSGALRKCVKSQQVAYTNVECPAGFKEQAVTAAPVNVVPATPVARGAEPQTSGSSAPSALHEALGLTRDDKLRDRITERAIEGATR
ncbi:hypothetical protein ACG04R_21745 [Roseateles sp. BYS78W]|uniref:DUF4124 domain-containing protein n=1 Tax=Pelomonas candidula TaxID=3299025 RepID=A0ABW7HIK6_9BURK